ncbi:hypothetical protein [Nitratiruptor sp. YY09-18]|uniref:hypothetical protein n=1 Tax=Nitratiruptor sp. YY09-18 TaxID=2724901 RepID=UPI0019159C26|nr:hypothetical protein [Nitratiruptor sp. YY09-18]BCD67702.1 hypothetical protein NitYY0918_C0603 [Nitratiruptor sp. YY09-18]
MRFFIVSLFVITTLFANSIENFFSVADNYIYTYLDALDIWLSGVSSKVRPSFYIQASLTSAYEERHKPLYRLNLKSNFTLPRTSKKLKLFFEDFRQKEAIDNQNAENINDVTKNESYLLGLTYNVRNKLSYRVGMKLNSIDPFAGLRYDGRAHFENLHIYYGFDYRYYIKRQHDTSIFCNFTYPLSSSTTFAFENNYRYQEKSDYKNQFVTSLKLYQSHQSSNIIYHADIYANDSSSQNMEINYYYTGVDWYLYFMHHHLFTALSPGIMWRNTKGYQKDYRFMLTLGVQLWKK